MIKVSVIIPVYNTEKYLSKCLDSVCNQTLTDIEIICINDCSLDNSLNIIHDYAQKDNRVKCIDFNENKGAAVARNTGIDCARGEYIAFVDSDDFIDLDFYEKLYNKAIHEKADCVKGNYRDANTGNIDYYLNKKIEEYQTNFAYAYCSAIFKRDIIAANEIYFPNAIDMEDPVFTLKFALLMNKIVIVNDACINIVRRDTSLTSGIPSEEQVKAKCNGLNTILEIVNKGTMPKESYAYVLAFWFQQTFVNSFTNIDCRDYLIEFILSVFHKVKFKELFIDELAKRDSVIADCLKNNKQDELIHYDENGTKKNILLQLRNKIKKTLKPKISVIIPVYNAKDYLAACLDSVCNQTLKELEIICVNDCSMDNSLEILNEYAQKDSRVKIIDCKVNGGESKARNFGLDRAIGEFIAFVDNDDKLDLDFYEKLYNKAKETNADIVKGNVITIGYDGKPVKSVLNPLMLKMNDKWFFHHEWWSAIYKSKLIKENNIKLLEGYVLGGDILFLNEALYYAKKVEVVNDTAYNWIRREDSGESALLSNEKVFSVFFIVGKILNNINNWFRNNELNGGSYDFIMRTCFWYPLDYIFRNDDPEAKKTCIEFLINLYNNCLRKEQANVYLKSNAYYFYEDIIHNDITSLFDKVMELKNEKEFTAKNIFYKLKDRNFKH